MTVAEEITVIGSVGWPAIADAVPHPPVGNITPDRIGSAFAPHPIRLRGSLGR
jgi:hypothetical protein